jgi:hypothetical protein
MSLYGVHKALWLLQNDLEFRELLRSRPEVALAELPCWRPVDNGSGTPMLLDGGVSGVFLDDSTVDFTAQLNGERRHLGVVRADSIIGSWSGSTSGTFKAARGPV